MIGIDFSNGSLMYLLELILGPGPIWAISYGPQKLKKHIFGKIQNCHQSPYGASEKKVEKTKKFTLNELQLEWQDFSYRWYSKNSHTFITMFWMSKLFYGM